MKGTLASRGFACVKSVCKAQRCPDYYYFVFVNLDFQKYSFHITAFNSLTMELHISFLLCSSTLFYSPLLFVTTAQINFNCFLRELELAGVNEYGLQTLWQDF